MMIDHGSLRSRQLVSSHLSHYSCEICGRKTSLQTCKTDENGQIVHEHCYARRVGLPDNSTQMLRRKNKRSLIVPETSARLGVLSGWKDVANYLGRGIRTVQRYERDERLPIRRPAGKSSAPVVAMQAELDNWITTGASPVDSKAARRALESRTNRLRADF